MADRFPLILNTSANQIQEIASGDTLDLTDVNISNAGVITATSFAGDGSGLIGVASTDNIVTGTAATFNNTVDINSDLDVDGHTELDNVNIVGVTTVAGHFMPAATNTYDIGGDIGGGLKVWRQIKTKNISVVGGITTTSILHVSDIGRGTNNADVNIIQEGTGKFTVNRDSELRDVMPETDSTHDLGKPSVRWKESYMDLLNSHDIIAIGATFSGNVSIGGTLTYEDVTNIDSVGIITARSDVKVGTGVTLTPAGAGFFSGIITATSGDFVDIDVDGTAELDDVNVTGSLDVFNVRRAVQTNTRINFGDNLVSLQTGATPKLILHGSNVNVVGVLTASSFYGDGSNLTGVGISTEQVTPSSNVATLDLTKNEHKIVASGTYTIDVNGGTEADSHVIRVENSGISTVGFSTYFKFPSGGTPALPTASGAISLISFTVHKVGSVGIATVLLAGASVNFS